MAVRMAMSMISRSFNDINLVVAPFFLRELPSLLIELIDEPSLIKLHLQDDDGHVPYNTSRLGRDQGVGVT